jgi:citrate lyase beta subunit
MRSRRALLYVPGNDFHKIEKASNLEVDGVILDLEDGVALNRKDEARNVVAEALKKVDFGHSERLVRINPISSGRLEMDLECVLPCHPDAIVIPKVNNTEVISLVDRRVARVEKLFGWERESIALIVLVESSRAFFNLPAICSSSERLQALIFGAEDFSEDVGITRTPAAMELLYARSTLVMNASAFDLQAIDMVQTNYSDTQQLTLESNQGAEFGFSGKQIIHPAQIEIVQKAFTPSQKAIDSSLKIIEEAKIAQSEGRGAFTIDGKMVDMPVIKQAERVIARARAAGLINSH